MKFSVLEFCIAAVRLGSISTQRRAHSSLDVTRWPGLVVSNQIASGRLSRWPRDSVEAAIVIGGNLKEANRGRTLHRRPDIQGLRGLAIALVVVYHAYSPFMPSGFVGVDVFFVISGWVIAQSVIERWESSGTFAFKEFWWRRARRLIPAFGLMITFVSVASVLILAITPATQTLWTGLLAMFSIANIGVYRFTGDYFSLEASLNPLIHTWSLAVEEQYYFGFSILLSILVLGKFRRVLPQMAFSVFSSIFVLSLVAAFLGYTDAIDGWVPEFLFGFYSPIPRLWEFSVGVVGYLLVRERGRSTGVFGLATFCAGVVLIFLGASGVFAVGTAPFSSEIAIAVLGSFMVMASDGGEAGQVILENRVMVWLGDRSYSIYLWHWPMIVFSWQVMGNFGFAGILGALASVPMAMWSYRFIEKKQLWPDVSEIRLARFFGLKFLMVPVLVVAAMMFVTAVAQSTLDQPETMNRMDPCINLSQSPLYEVCKWNSSDPSAPTVWLIGDSNANHYRTGLYSAALETGTVLGVSVRNSCPPLSPLPAGISFPDGCEQNNELLFAYLANQESGLIVMGMSISRWLGLSAHDEGANVLDSLEESISKLQRAGHRVAVVSPLPPWSETARVGPAYCGIPFLLQENCVAYLALKHADPAYEPFADSFQQQVELSNAEWLDVRDTICPQGVCLSREPGGEWIWLDRAHISTSASERLAPIFSRFLEKASNR